VSGQAIVIRRYVPDTAILDSLVEALYVLLMDVPNDAFPPPSVLADSACLSARHE
jgi:hypothetical protein